jgi:hypothetical protein
MTGERIAVFVCGVAFLVTMLVVVLVVPNPTPTQLWVFRIIVAVAAAGFAAFLPGALDVQVSTWVKAGGALGVFVIVYFFNPPELVAKRVKVHEGMLGNLYDHLQSEPASDRKFTFTLGEVNREELRRVYISPEKRGDTWAELFGQICDAYLCLACSPPASKITTSVSIELKDGPKGLREVGGPVKAYTCK